MTAFTPIAFIDVWALSGTLRSKLGLFSEGRYEARRASQDGEGWVWDGEVRKSWGSLWNVLRRIERHPASAGHEMGAAWIEQLEPHTESAWSSSGPGAWVEVAIVTNPSAYVFCGTSWAHFEQGHAIAVNRGLRCCSVNWGDHPRFHLIAEFQPKPKEDEDV